MANEYKAWYRRNNPQNARQDLGAFNRPFKERYERPPAYPQRGEEYGRFSERYDLSKDQEEKTNNTDKKQEEEKAKEQIKRRANSARGQTAVKSVVQTVVGNTVAVVVGAVVVVGGYQAIEAEKAREEVVPIVIESEQWNWSDDYQTASVSLYDINGELIEEVEATVELIEEVKSTCAVKGSRTYMAKAIYDDAEFSNETVEILELLPHTFDEGKLVITENGPNQYVYECTQCDEKMIIELSEEEGE